MTSLFTITVFRFPVVPSYVYVHSTLDALSSPLVVFVPEKIRRVTVALGRMSKFGRGGSGSMYAEREYERVQLVGLMADVAMNEPEPSPPSASVVAGMPSAVRVFVQSPTIG